MILLITNRASFFIVILVLDGMLTRSLVDRIYVELADQYKAMDAASDMGKRNLLANHLREVIDVLEQKVSPSRLFFGILAVLTSRLCRVIKSLRYTTYCTLRTSR